MLGSTGSTSLCFVAHVYPTGGPERPSHDMGHRAPRFKNSTMYIWFLTACTAYQDATPFCIVCLLGIAERDYNIQPLKGRYGLFTWMERWEGDAR